ncbi:hypothetical protein [Streptomyces sp. YIM 130001]|uniref:hypothetical protein n=1 Tax=Streptomyces sp. YIM 130001 TaxID=2259644 RepID=UPI000E64F828|nr:hypothetical protein [Streptomyces sp. YIM 130001]
MRVISAAATAALTTVTALSLAVPSAFADEQPSFSATPNPAKPGDSVILSVSGGCQAESATATSEVFDSVVPLSTGSAGIYTGTAKIRSGASAGAHPVQVDCEGSVSSYSINISASTTSTPTPTATPTNPAPSRGVQGGLGGSSDDLPLAPIALGSGLIAALGGTLWFRNRRPTRR